MTGVEPLSADWVARHLPDRPDGAHKGTFGTLLVVGGSLELPGAVLLTALGAMRAGVGVARIATAESIAARLAGSIPEITWMALDEEAPGLIAPGGWRRISGEANRADAVVVGPGLGRQPATQRRARQLIASTSQPTVVDADGLNALADDAGWPRGQQGPRVLTPHPAEFARLTNGQAPDGADDEARADAATTAAARWGVVVVLKGARTVVAAPDGRSRRSDVSTPALATAGTGDILAGVIGAFLAAGVGAYEAAACGVAVHGRAGLLGEERIGRAGTMARDFAQLLPEAIGALRAEGGA